MFFGGEDLSFSDAAVIFARCLAISDPKEKREEPFVDPSEVGDDGADAVALKDPSACMRLTLRVATSVFAVSTRTVILSESS